MDNIKTKNRALRVAMFAITVFVLFVCCTIQTVSATESTEPTTVPTEPHSCSWRDDKWEWTVDKDGLASYTMTLKCDGCGATKTYKNQNKLYPAKSDKTFAATCTTNGANFYSVEVQYDGQIFVGYHEAIIKATGHSYSTDAKYEITVNAQNQQYHYLKCTHSNCPDKGKVLMANCAATGTNVAVCGQKAKCDVCKNTFGDVLEHKYVNGTCEHCKKEHTPHVWENGVCTGCKFEHKDHKWGAGECQVCKIMHDPHDWDRGLCKVCGFVSSEHNWKDGFCEDCKMEHISHKWEDGTCAVCLLVHEHDRWSNGKCITCQLEHTPHEWENGTCKICKYKHEPHQYQNGACEICDIVCKHKDFKNGTCDTCGYSDYQIYIGSIQQYQLQSNNRIVIKTNATVDQLKEVLIDSYPVAQKYLECIGKEVAVDSEFLNRLSVGTHDLVLIYENGQIETTFTISEATIVVDSSSSVWVFVILGLVSVAAIVIGVCVVIFRVKQERDESMAEQYARQHSQQTYHPPIRPVNQAPQATQQPQRPKSTPLYTQADEEEMVRKIEEEIGVNVSKFLNENKNNNP